jgi:hypothetical protein
MASPKASGPSHRGDDGGPRGLEQIGRRLCSTLAHLQSLEQIKSAAHRDVREMLALGAVFSVKHYGNGPHWIFSLPAGGDRARCREIVREAKQADAAYWRAFVDAILGEGGR